MKKIVFNKNKYKSYRDFYEDLYKQTDGAGFIDWAQCPNLNYDAGLLYEFLCYCNIDGEHLYIFLNFDKEKLLKQKTVEDCEYSFILKIFDAFVKEYPNNKLEFKNE